MMDSEINIKEMSDSALFRGLQNRIWFATGLFSMLYTIFTNPGAAEQIHEIDDLCSIFSDAETKLKEAAVMLEEMGPAGKKPKKSPEEAAN